MLSYINPTKTEEISLKTKSHNNKIAVYWLFKKINFIKKINFFKFK